MDSNTTLKLNLLKDEFQTKIATIDLTDRPVERSNVAIHIVRQYINQLKHLRPEEFTDRQTEIHFYRNIVPYFYGQLVFFIRVFQLESGLPQSSASRRKYFTKERKKIERYYASNLDAYQYFNTDDESLDSALFVASATLLPIGIDESLLLTELEYCTPMSLKFARFIGYELLMDYVSDALKRLVKAGSGTVPMLRFKGKKIGVVEIVYALFYSEDIDEAGIKEIAQCFGQVLSVDLGNIYRMKSDLYTRKNVSSYLDFLSKRLRQGLDEDEEKHISKNW